MHVAHRNQLLHEYRIDGCPSTDEVIQRSDELIYVRDARFQQVATPLTTPDEICRFVYLDVSRQHEYGDGRKFLANHSRCCETFSCECRWHSDVDDHKVRFEITNQLNQLHRVARLSDHRKTPAHQKTCEALTEEEVIVCNHHSNRHHFPNLASLEISIRLGVDSLGTAIARRILADHLLRT